VWQSNRCHYFVTNADNLQMTHRARQCQQLQGVLQGKAGPAQPRGREALTGAGAPPPWLLLLLLLLLLPGSCPGKELPASSPCQATSQ